jgi:hypothetical protein
MLITALQHKKVNFKSNYSYYYNQICTNTPIVLKKYQRDIVSLKCSFDDVTAWI